MINTKKKCKNEKEANSNITCCVNKQIFYFEFVVILNSAKKNSLIIY